MTHSASPAVARNPYLYAVLRMVPSVERAEFINVGVVLYCRAQRFLAAHIALHPERLHALSPNLDAATITLLQSHLAQVPKICHGEGPIGQLSQPERFRWLVAPRSTMLQASATHSGLCHDPQASLDHLFETLVA